MIIQPKVRGFICTTAHPTGCAANVNEEIEYVKSQSPIQGPKKILVIGASTGYGLASRIVGAFGSDAKTIGVSFEKPAEGKRTASAGWYNTAQFEKAALDAGLYAKSINGDAFSNEIKEKTIKLIQEDWGGEVDLVIYSLAAPKRIDPNTGKVYNSVLKPIGQVFESKNIDTTTGVINQVALEPAKPEEIDHTVAVMGGVDWALWIQALMQADVLAKGVMTLAYSYLGPELTHPIYREGTVGMAKAHLAETAQSLTHRLKNLDGKAMVSVNKALVTQASAAIPVVPLYLSILYKVMAAKGLHEDCIEQMYRLFNDRLYRSDGNIPVDENGLIRLDDWELKPEVQSEVSQIWEQIETDNVEALSDFNGYQEGFRKLFGFGLDNVNYDEDVEPNVSIPSID